jgi:hypothetical protein
MDNLEKMMQQILSQIGGIEEKMDSNQAKATKQEEMLAELNAKMDANLAVIKYTINAFKEKMEPNPEDNETVVEHQGIPREDVVVRPVKGLKKRRRGRKLIAERRGEPKKGTRGYSGSRKKVTVAGKWTSRHAAVAWLKRKLFRRSRIKEQFGPRKELNADVMRKSPEGNNGIRHRDVKVLPHLRKERKTTNGIKGWSTGQRSYLGSGGTPSKYPYQIFGGKIAKQVVGTSRRLRKIRKWVLWRGRPPPKRKKEFQVEGEPVM